MIQAIIDWFKALLAKLLSPLPSPPTPEPSPAAPVSLPSAPGPAPSPVAPSGELSYGPDESHYEPNINFQELATDNVFSGTKATQGISYVDALFAKYWKGMVDAGLIRIAYHFFDPTMDPIAQAKHFLSTVGALGPYDLLALDFEPLPEKGITAPTPESAADAEKFLDYVDSQTKRETWLYADYDYLQNYDCMKRFATRPTWMAYPGHKVVAIPKGWKAIQIWQYTFTGTYKGVPQKIDGNIFFGNKAEMMAYIDSLKIA